MFRQFSVAACVVATCSVALAQQSVATSGSVAGGVVVNKGSGFTRLAADEALAPGDRVMAKFGGRTTIVYADGCVVKVRAGSTVTVQATSPCNVAAAPVEPVGAVGGVGVTGAVVGAGAAAGIITAIVLATTQNNNGPGPGPTSNPMSP